MAVTATQALPHLKRFVNDNVVVKAAAEQNVMEQYYTKYADLIATEATADANTVRPHIERFVNDSQVVKMSGSEQEVQKIKDKYIALIVADDA